MLSFTNLFALTPHRERLQTLFSGQEMFVVGWTIRDLLLGIDKEIIDIDLTGAGSPDSWREQMQLPETGWSRFRTEKFGTMTLVDKTPHGDFFYEITPFREESGYADNRHPEAIVWSNDLLADSRRRDFTINALYRQQKEATDHLINQITTKKSQTITIKDNNHLLTILKQHGWCVMLDTQTIILQDHGLIADFLKNNILGVLPVCNMGTDLMDHTRTDKASLVSTEIPTTNRSLIFDPQQWINDLVHRKIRAVGTATERFTEDALRILRGIRFVNLLNQHLPHTDRQNSGFDIEKKTRQAMEQTAPLVSTLSAERLHAELVKVFSGTNPFGYIALIRELLLLPTLFPALAGTVDNWQPVRYHPFDTYNHTLLTLRHCQQLLQLSPEQDPVAHMLVKFAMLYHDVGKPEQYAFMDAALAANPENPDRTGYVAHPEIGVKLAHADFSRLAFSHKEIDQICRYIKHHHRPGEILDSKPETWPKKLRELISDGGYEATMHLLTIATADRLGQYNPLQKAAISELDHLKTLVTDLYTTEWRFTIKQLAINGSDLMQDFWLTPGPQIGTLLQKAFEWVMNEVTARNTKEEIYKYLKTFLS